METLKNNISVVELVPCTTYDADLDGSENPVDMHADQTFQTVLAQASIGDITGTPDSVSLSFVEGDEADLSDASAIEGGDAVDVSANTAYTYQLNRTKRYIGAVLTFTNGTSPTAEVAVLGLLTNWAKPMPLV